MDMAKILEYHQIETSRRKDYNKIIKFALFEASILIVSSVLLALIFIKLDSVALPISLENGSVISFEAVQGIGMKELLWPVVVIALCLTTIATFLYTRFFPKD